jgi:hypothetical protein
LILIGAVSNTIVRAVLATVLGGWALGRTVLVAYGAMLTAALLTGIALWKME